MLRLADALDVPVHARNDWLAAAGLPPAYPSDEPDVVSILPYRRAVAYVLSALVPVPAMIIGPGYGLIAANAAAAWMIPSLATTSTIIDGFLDTPMRERLVNYSAVAWAWRERVLRDLTDGDADLEAVLARIERHLRGVARPKHGARDEPGMSPVFQIDDRVVRTIGMTLRAGPDHGRGGPELTIEAICPRDPGAEQFFRELATREG